MEIESTVLFLCTGNYYRSRFAEEYFNHHAAELGISWRAESMGLHRNFPRPCNPGPISPYALSALERFEVKPVGAERFPRKALADDFARTTRWIALSREEHLPMVTEQYPEQLERMEFWEVGDLPLEAPEQATQKIARLVDDLLAEIRG